MKEPPEGSCAKTPTNCERNFDERPSQWQPKHLTSFLGVVTRNYESCLKHLLQRSTTTL